MRGNEKVIEQLNINLRSELSAIVQYMTQSEMCSNWGYARLGGQLRARAIEEMRHAETLIERIIFLDAVPKVEVGLTPQLGNNVTEQMDLNLKDEHDAVKQYNVAVKVCMDNNDEGSRVLFEKLLQDEEKHVDWLEAQIHSIKEMGIAQYLAQQLPTAQ